MKALRRPCVAVCLCLAASLLPAGCQQGSPRYVASGTILFNNQPLSVPSPLPPGETAVRVQLIPIAGSDTSKSGASQPCSYDNATGKFKTTGTDDKGVEAGKYHVMVTHTGDDAVNAKYNNPNSPLTVEVKSGGDTDPAVLNLTVP